MSYTLILLLHSFGNACRSNRRRPTIHYFVRSHVSSDADFKRSPLLAGGCSAGQVLAFSSVECHLSEYATIPCLGLPVFLQRCPTIDGGRPLISDSTIRAWSDCHRSARVAIGSVALVPQSTALLFRCDICGPA